VCHGHSPLPGPETPPCELNIPPAPSELNLTSIDLSGDWDITAMRGLDQLYLHNCNISTLPRGIWSLPHLTGLDFCDCPVFSDFTGPIPATAPLRRLVLINCPELHSLPNSLCRLTGLTKITLDSMDIVHLPDNFSALTSLRDLEIAHCPLLRNMPPNLSNLTQLTYLEINNPGPQDIDDIDVQFAAALPNLCTLSLKGCMLRGAQFGSTQTRLTALYINSLRPLTDDLPSSIGMLRNLSELHITECNILSLPETIWQLTALTNLHVDMCSVMAIPDAISQLTNLERCNLAALQRDIPDAIGHLTKLTYVRIAGVEGQLPATLTSLTRLHRLDVGLPKLTGAFPAIDTLHNLRELRFDHLDAIMPGVKAGSVLARCTNITNLYANVDSRVLNHRIVPFVPGMTGLRELELRVIGQINATPDWGPDLPLPEAMTNLTKLTALTVAGREFHDVIFQLTALESLDIAWVKTESPALPAAIGRLTNLHTLIIPKGVALCKQLTALTRLTRITRGDPSWYMNDHYATIARLVDQGVLVDMD
jgi:Leucine-rich repeat (LRR) protein